MVSLIQPFTRTSFSSLNMTMIDSRTSGFQGSSMSQTLPTTTNFDLLTSTISQGNVFSTSSYSKLSTSTLSQPSIFSGGNTTSTYFELSTSTAPQTNIQVSITTSVLSGVTSTFTTSFQASSSSVSPGITDVSKDSESQLSVAVVGGGVGAVVLLVVVVVVGVGLFCIRRRRLTSKVVLSSGGVCDLDNPVYESKYIPLWVWIFISHINENHLISHSMHRWSSIRECYSL